MQLMIIKIIIMLCFLKLPRQKFHTLKKHLTPNYFTILQSRLHESPPSKQKLQKLAQLDKKKHLYKYLTSRQKESYSIQQIYYYLHKKKQSNIQFYIPSRKLLNNQQLLCIDQFIIAREERMLKSLEVQRKLIKCFCENCEKFGVGELLMGLGIIGEFSVWVVKNNLDKEKVRHRVLDIYKEGNDLITLDVLHALKENSLLLEILNEEQCKEIVQKISSKISNSKYSSKNLYFLQQLQRQFNIPINQSQRQKKAKSILSNQKSTTKQQMYYTLKIVDKYPEFVKFVHYDSMEPCFYIKFLEIMKKQQNKNNQQIPLQAVDSDLPSIISVSDPVDYHQIPQKVLKQATSHEFSTIIQLRLGMDLQNRQELSKIMKDTMKINKNIIIGLISFLNMSNIEDPKIWMDLQKYFLKQLGLNHKKWTVEDILANYYVEDLFSILSYMANNNNGSVKFWKVLNQFVFDVLMLKKITFKKTDTNYNDFIINIYGIYQNRTIPESLFDKITNMTLVTLVNNTWTERELLKLAKTMALSKIDTHEIWYAIQNKLMSLNINYRKGEDQVIIFANILKYFQQMNVGTYQFKKTIQKILNANKFDYQAFLKIKRNPINVSISNDVSIKKMDMQISQLEN